MSLSIYEHTVELEGTITRIEPTDFYGAEHQKFDVESHGSTYLIIIRFGDKMGLKEPIPIKIGDNVEVKGKLIEVDDEPAIHFTHHPVGFIKVNGHMYE
jgi:hypothetical protein